MLVDKISNYFHFIMKFKYLKPFCRALMWYDRLLKLPWFTIQHKALVKHLFLFLNY